MTDKTCSTSRKRARDARRTAAGLEQCTGDRGFFGHPRGLSTLFFTEMWERFSYYGIRPLLVLFMTAALAQRRIRLRSRPTASAIVGIYAASRVSRVAARRLDRRPMARTATRDLVRRRAHRARPPLDRAVGDLRAPGVLPRPDPHRHRAPGCSSRTSRRSSAISIPKAARAATPASRSSTWASTSARSSRRSSPASSASAWLALGLRRRRRRHAHRTRSPSACAPTRRSAHSASRRPGAPRSSARVRTVTLVALGDHRRAHRARDGRHDSRSIPSPSRRRMATVIARHGAALLHLSVLLRRTRRATSRSASSSSSCCSSSRSSSGRRSSRRRRRSICSRATSPTGACSAGRCRRRGSSRPSSFVRHRSSRRCSRAIWLALGQRGMRPLEPDQVRLRALRSPASAS